MPRSLCLETRHSCEDYLIRISFWPAANSGSHRVAPSDGTGEILTGFLTHEADSEGRQEPDPGEPWWQDSVFVAWHARDAGIGGLFRIGHEPTNEAGAKAALWFGIVTAEGVRYRRNGAFELTDADRLENGFGALDGRYRQVYDGKMRYLVDDENLHMELEVEDFYPRTDFFPPDAGTVSEDFASAHYECSGAISGLVRLGGTDYEVSGLCHRDHSWGARRWDTLLNHRWMPGTFGPELSFGAIAWHGIDGSLRQFGYVVRGGEVTVADEVDIAVTFEADGVTYRRGSTRWKLPGGESLEIEAAPYDGVVSEHHGVGLVDAICELERDGAFGFCDLEVSTNPRAGSAPIATALLANNENGLSRRD